MDGLREVKTLVTRARDSIILRLSPRARAARYVGSTSRSGRVQLEILQREGLTPGATVLEIGCGALHAGLPIIEYVEHGRYVGLDPNEWLREPAIRSRRNAATMAAKQPQFLTREDFDASELGLTFDFVLSHSVLSHAAHWQLSQFFEATAKVLAPGGRIVASIRLAEGNRFGSPGSPSLSDSLDEAWVYPGTSYFTLPTIEKTAALSDLRVCVVEDHTARLTEVRPEESHDWLVLERVTESRLS